LSLIVDYPNDEEPKPLPNLDCNIICGNSLVDEFEGIRLVKESEFLGSTESYQRDFTSDQFDAIIRKLIETQDELFKCDDTEKKKQLKDQIESLRDMIIQTQLEGCDAGKKQRYYESTNLASKPYTLWQLDVARVFREKGGFDIVIGNPPYVGEKGNKELFRPIAATDFGKKYYYGKMDLFYFFFHKGLDIGNANAEVSFITTNYYPTAFGGKVLRKDFMDRTNIRRLINFNELKIFESALGQHNMITMLTKKKTSEPAQNCLCKISGVANSAILRSVLYAGNSDNNYFEHRLVHQDKLYDGDEYYIRLLGTGGNGADSVDSILSKIAAAPQTLKGIADIKQGIVSGADKYTDAHQSKFALGIPKGTGIFVLRKDEIDQLVLSELERTKYVKATYKNHEIGKYMIDYENNLFVFYLTDYTPAEDVPNILSYLEQFKPLLENRLVTYGESYPWYSLHRARNEAILGSSRKIVNSRRAKGNTFALSNENYFEQSDLMITVVKKQFADRFPTKYVLALLNSKLYYLWLKNRGKVKGDMLELYGKPLEEIPIKAPDTDTAQRIISHVDAILSGHSNMSAELEQIDALIYALYDLSEAEIQLIRDFE
jgi:adenine-specific DNA-methyltransferase